MLFLEYFAERKQQIMKKLLVMGKPAKGAKPFEIRNSVNQRLEIQNDVIIIYINVDDFLVALPKTRANLLDNFVVDYIQLLYFGSKSNNLDRKYLYSLLK